MEYLILDNKEGGKVMYNYGGSFGSSCGCGGYAAPAYAPYYPSYGCGCGNNNYAIILVLFILLVIVLGSRCAH